MNSKSTTIKMIAVLLSIMTFIGSASATTSKNYQQGVRDAAIDCTISDPNQWLMNTASNANHHSQAYLDGHAAGMASCQSTVITATENQNSNNVNQNNRNQAQAQSANPNQNCFTLIGTCTTTTAQGQSLNN